MSLAEVISLCPYQDEDSGRTIIEQALHMCYVIRIPREPVYALYVQTKQLYSLNTLIHNHRNGGAISLEQLVQSQAKDGIKRG